MSHTTKSTLAVRDWELFANQVAESGGSFDRNARSFKYWNGSTGQCNGGVISFPDATWQVGVNVDEDGNASLLMDNYYGGGGMVAKIGRDGCELKERYTDAMITKLAREQGMTVRKVPLTAEQVSKGVQAYWEVESGDSAQARV